jgi:hypothetical protein
LQKQDEEALSIYKPPKLKTEREKDREKETGSRKCGKSQKNRATKSHPPSTKTVPLFNPMSLTTLPPFYLYPSLLPLL